MTGPNQRQDSEPIRTGDHPPEPATAAAPLDSRRRRLLFRATHRGTHENDFLIGGFVAVRIKQFGDAELDQLDAILDMPEPDLADYLTGRLPIPQDLDLPMLHDMRNAAGR